MSNSCWTNYLTILVVYVLRMFLFFSSWCFESRHISSFKISLKYEPHLHFISLLPIMLIYFMKKPCFVFFSNKASLQYIFWWNSFWSNNSLPCGPAILSQRKSSGDHLSTVVDKKKKKKVSWVHYNQHYPRVRTKELVWMSYSST